MILSKSLRQNYRLAYGQGKSLSRLRQQAVMCLAVVMRMWHLRLCQSPQPKVAGVENVIACTAPHGDEGPNPAILYAMNLCGADQILSLAVFRGLPQWRLVSSLASQLVSWSGPVTALWQRQNALFMGVLALICLLVQQRLRLSLMTVLTQPSLPKIWSLKQSMDLIHQHGSLPTSQALADAVTARIDSHIETLPEPARSAATAAWRDYGEIILCDTDEEMAVVSDEYAAEHLEVHTKNDEWFTARSEKLWLIICW